MDGDYDAIENLPADGERQREMYARYGLAMYCAQVFEHGLVNAIVLARQVNGVIVDQIDWDRTFETPFKKATSELARRVGCYGGLNDAELTLLQTAVSERNRLAHRFFRDHVENTMSARGMQRVVDDADQARELFGRADLVTERLCKQAMTQLDLPPDAREIEVARLRAEIRERDGD